MARLRDNCADCAAGWAGRTGTRCSRKGRRSSAGHWRRSRCCVACVRLDNQSGIRRRLRVDLRRPVRRRRTTGWLRWCSACGSSRVWCLRSGPSGATNRASPLSLDDPSIRHRHRHRHYPDLAPSLPGNRAGLRIELRAGHFGSRSACMRLIAELWLRAFRIRASSPASRWILA